MALATLTASVALSVTLPGGTALVLAELERSTGNARAAGVAADFFRQASSIPEPDFYQGERAGVLPEPSYPCGSDRTRSNCWREVMLTVIVLVAVILVSASACSITPRRWNH